jgi:hypothetical protein
MIIKKQNTLQVDVASRQGRNQGRRQPAPGHPLGSLKNKGRTIKNKISFDPNILFICTGHPLSIVSDSAPAFRFASSSTCSTTFAHLALK